MSFQPSLVFITWTPVLLKWMAFALRALVELSGIRQNLSGESWGAFSKQSKMLLSILLTSLSFTRGLRAQHRSTEEMRLCATFLSGFLVLWSFADIAIGRNMRK